MAEYNKKYCKNTNNELKVDCAYGGYQVVLTGKRKKNGGFKGPLGSGTVEITYGHQSARDTLADLWKYDSKGDIKNKVKSYNK